jgi:hypothetical protein
MEGMLRAIEVEGEVDEGRHLHVKAPLPVDGPTRVRVIILIPFQGEIDESGWLKAAATSPAFEFLKDTAEDIYTATDGKPFLDPR